MMAKQPSKTQRKSTWKVPPAVPRGDVRAHISAITRHVKAGNEVFVGTSESLAYSAFISEAEFAKRRKSFPAEPRDFDIEALRQNWSREREHVENTGGTLRILRKREPVAYFVPTRRALDKKVPRNIAALEMSHISLLQKLDKRVTTLMSRTSNLQELDKRVTILETAVGTLNEVLTPEGVKEIRRALALSEAVLKEWRDRNGYIGEPPPGPPTL